MVYKWCVVPQCVNTSIKTPQKLFVSVPTNDKRRRKWLQFARRDPHSIVSHSNVFMCEDHFDMEKDTSNFMQYKLGFSKKILLTDEAVPTKFCCQGDGIKQLCDDGHSPNAFIEREGHDLVKDCLQSVNNTDVHYESLRKNKSMIEKIVKPEESMADDIEIEEHDVLDNPAIKNIFPDINKLKKELEYFDGVSPLPNITSQVLTKGSEQSMLISKNSLKLYQSWHVSARKIILGSKIKSKSNNIKYLTLKTSQTLQKATPKVLLYNIGPELHKSLKYCKSCLILFPDIKAFITHNNEKHWVEQVDVTNKLNFVGENSTSDCFHCNLNFPNQKSLVEHLYNVLKSKKKESENVIVNKNRNSQNNIDKSLKCNACATIFTITSSLRRHKKFCKGISKKDKESEENEKQLKINTIIGKTSGKLLCSLDSQDNLFYNYENVNNYSGLNVTYYRCEICSYYLTTSCSLTAHMLKKHKYKNCSIPEKVLFKSECQYCNFKTKENINSYNCHIQHHHKDLVYKAFNSETSNSSGKKSKSFKSKLRKSDSVNTSQTKKILYETNEHRPIDYSSYFLDSILFKCVKCDIHFLNANIALNHEKHMDQLLNWKCPTCCRIFKDVDKHNHIKQHELGNNFSTYKLCIAKDSLEKILYSCSKCAVFFEEASFFKHSIICGLEAPHSTYCCKCDVLIDYQIMQTHKKVHEMDSLSDFIFITEANLITLQSEDNNPQVMSNTKDETCKIPAKHCRTNDHNDSISKKKRFEVENCGITVLLKPNKHYTFCSTCKCFVTSIDDIHLNSLCVNIITSVCMVCGIVLPLSAMDDHRNLHLNDKGITLQDFDFFEAKTENAICPPIPLYPKCEYCNVYFSSSTDKQRHSCADEVFLTCHICNTRLSNDAFELHMAYHNYNIDNRRKRCFTINKPLKEPSMPVVYNNVDNLNILYTCQSCNINLDTYDKVVEHCRIHYERNEICKFEKCNNCSLMYDTRCFQDHVCDIEVNTYTHYIKFDTFYWPFDNEKWIMYLFDGIDKVTVLKLVEKSIYRYEHRIQLNIFQNGPVDLTVYQCSICKCYVCPSQVYSHLQNRCPSEVKFSCFLCSIPFESDLAREQHEKVHTKLNIGLKSYRIVLFDKEKNKNLVNAIYYSQYVIYQCRNCNSAIDRWQSKTHQCNINNLILCNLCGLVLNKNNYIQHNLRHERCGTYVPNNMKVVLFGKLLGKVKKIIEPTFKGIICDYTLYQCMKCEVCIKDKYLVKKHFCYNAVDARVLCSKCNYYYSSTGFKHHYNQHDKDLDYIRENMHVINFDLSRKKQSSLKTENGVHVSKGNAHNKELKIKYKIFRCTCGLNFLDRISISKHLPKCKVPSNICRQKCPKCDLQFKSDVLFDHILLHHGNREDKYAVDIVEMSQ